MKHLKTIAAGAAIAGTLGFAALGIGSGVANAAPASVASGTGFAQYGGWGHGPGPGPWRPGGFRGGPGWRGPGYYGGYGGYGGYGYGPPCISGPIGLLHVCA
jgi:hypothetical protein